LHVIVVGAGVGGLTCALSLARRGNVVTVLERAEGPAEVGAGLQLSPNATRVLIDLGLEDELRDKRPWCAIGPLGECCWRPVSVRSPSIVGARPICRFTGPTCTVF
jgi:hypothetical protein